LLFRRSVGLDMSRLVLPQALEINRLASYP
jgi:hypothetical protein